MIAERNGGDGFIPQKWAMSCRNANNFLKCSLGEDRLVLDDDDGDDDYDDDDSDDYYCDDDDNDDDADAADDDDVN